MDEAAGVPCQFFSIMLFPLSFPPGESDGTCVPGVSVWRSRVQLLPQSGSQEETDHHHGPLSQSDAKHSLPEAGSSQSGPSEDVHLWCCVPSRCITGTRKWTYPHSCSQQTSGSVSKLLFWVGDNWNTWQLQYLTGWRILQKCQNTLVINCLQSHHRWHSANTSIEPGFEGIVWRFGKYTTGIQLLRIWIEFDEELMFVHSLWSLSQQWAILLTLKGKNTARILERTQCIYTFRYSACFDPSSYISTHPALSFLLVARRRCVRERLRRWSSRWWMEQMAVSSVLDTPSLVTVTHTHTHTCAQTSKNPSECGLCIGFHVRRVCVWASVCQSLTWPSLHWRSSIRERKKRISVWRCWKHSQSAPSVFLSSLFSLSNPSEAGFREAVLKRVRTPYCTLQHAWTHTHGTGTIDSHTHTHTHTHTLNRRVSPCCVHPCTCEQNYPSWLVIFKHPVGVCESPWTAGSGQNRRISMLQFSREHFCVNGSAIYWNKQ